MKKVQLTIQLNNSFLKLLRAQCTLEGLGNLKETSKKHTAMDVLSLIVLLEAMGATEEQIHAETPPEWRNDIEAIHEKRLVIEEK
jgi:hypothetical protein